LQKKGEKEEDLLKELCADDAELLAVLGRMLYINPVLAISSKDLELLLKEAEKSIKDGNHEEAIREYRVVVDKAIFEATQKPEERDRYIEFIQNLASKTILATEKAIEEVEKKGSTDKVVSLKKKIEHYKFVSQRVDDILNVATHFYNERLAMLGDASRRKERIEKIQSMKVKATIEAREETERRETRRKARKEMKREERREAEKEEKKITEREAERRETRREKIRDMEQKERQEAWGDKERQEARREAREKEDK
jgi:hypothetical protein